MNVHMMVIEGESVSTSRILFSEQLGWYVRPEESLEGDLICHHGFGKPRRIKGNFLNAKLRDFPVDLMRTRWLCISVHTSRQHKGGLAFVTSKGILLQPFIQHCAPEHAILIPKADPDEDPDERFSVVAIQVLDFALEGGSCEKVQGHEWYCSCALSARGSVSH
jgi:hypothetical protein